MLDYIDFPMLGGPVQRALIRGESYHQLSPSAAYAHGNRFRIHSPNEHEPSNACSSLVGNAVAY
jgi:hypothetical protein